MRLAGLPIVFAAAIALACPGQAFAWPARGIDSTEMVRWRMKTDLAGGETARACRPCAYSDYTLEFGRYSVRVVQRHDGVGESLHVTRRISKTLRSRVVNTISEDMGSFLGLYGDYLFVDVSSCPCPCGLVIYDLSTGRRIFEAVRMDTPHGPTIRNGRWLIYEEDLGDPEWDCPQAAKWKDMGTGFEEEVWLDLKTLKKTRTGKITCSARQ